MDIVIAYTPPEAQHDLQALIGDDTIYIPQVGNDLGERLVSATQWAAQHGYTKILIVGSDSPTLPIPYISEAITLLDTRDIVIGPSVDGGYYLIGFSVENLPMIVPYMFEEIRWSTADVLRQTVTRIQSTEATLGLLPPWYDIDTPEDLAFLHAHISALRLAGDTVQAVRTESFLASILMKLNTNGDLIMGQLDRKFAIVTGGNRGIGKGIARGLAAEGASLTIAARNAELLEQTANELRENGAKVLAVPTDVTDEQQIKALFEKAMAEYGRLDILVNNAGAFNAGPIDELSTEDWGLGCRREP